MAAEFEGRKAQVLIFRFQFQLFRQVKKSQQEKQGFDYSHPPKNSNRSFSFLSEKKSNFVKALDHLEASQQQSINISIEEGDAACGAQLGCGPARDMNYIWQNVVSLSFYVLWIHVMVVGFQFCRHELEPDKHRNTLAPHWGNWPLLSPLYISTTTYSQL